MFCFVLFVCLFFFVLFICLFVVVVFVFCLFFCFVFFFVVVVVLFLFLFFCCFFCLFFFFHAVVDQLSMLGHSVDSLTLKNSIVDFMLLNPILQVRYNICCVFKFT